MIMSWTAFQTLGSNFIAFTDGNYVMSQGGYHDFWTSHGGTTNNPPAPTKGMTQFDAIQDQFMAEAGFSHPAPGVKGLGLTFSVRAEGVPVHNLIGNDLGFRRPGIGVALTPGFIYTRGPHMVQFSVGKLVIRDRMRSYAEEVNGSNTGDAAFANYVWMGGYTLRIPGRRGGGADAADNHPDRPQATGSTHTPASGAPESSQNVSGTFKPFSLKTLDGKRKTLKDFSNKLTLVSFFFPRCPYCNVELPEIQKIYDKYKDQGLSAVWVNILPEETSLIAGWQMAKNLTVPVLVGGSQEGLQRDYHINSTPATYLLDKDGRVLYHKDGYEAGDEKKLEARIEAELKVAPAGTATPAALPPCPEPSEDFQPSVPAARFLEVRGRE